jgi:Flp pilus assembly protein TadD
MLYPAHLVADYSPGVLMPVDGFGPRVWAGLLVGGLVVVVAGWAWGRARAITLGVAWFVVAVLPVSNLVIPVGILLAERTLYLPSVGVALAVGGVVARVRAERPGWTRPLAVALVAVVALAGVRTWTRTPTWRTTSTVLGTLAEDHPESFRVQWLEADRLRSAGRLDQALTHYRRAVSLVPAHYQLRMQHGQALLQARRYDQAGAAFRAARNLVPELPEAHAFLMAALLRAGRADEAVAAGRDALRWHPGHRGMHHQLAIALTRTGRWPEALEARRESIRLGGERAAWQQSLHEAELLLRLGRDEAAAEALAAAHERAPADASPPTLPALRRAVETADTAVLPYR